MSPSQDANRQIPFDLAREREFFRYLPRDHTAYPFAPFDDASQSTFAAQPSRDYALNAFAQLGAMKMDAQRAMISLFGRSHEYILAESTRTLSLPGDNVTNPDDKLWLGCCILSKRRGLGKEIATLPHSDPSMEHAAVGGSALVIPDLKNDERFGSPNLVNRLAGTRFYAGVPIISPRGIIIGSFCVVDSQPKERPLDEPALAFMKDMAVTIMRHLHMVRTNHENRVAERMIVGLGNFVAGKATLRDPEDADEIRLEERKFPDEITSLPHRGRGKKIDGPGDTDLPPALQKPVEPENVESQEESKENAPNGSSTPSGGEPNQDQPVRGGPIRRESTSFKSTISGDKLQSPTPGTAYNDLFSRAANLIRESIEVDGVAFLDASIDSFGGLVSGTSHRVHESFPKEATSSGDDTTDSGSPPDPAKSEDEDLCTCRTLGFSVPGSPPNSTENSKFAIRERFLKAILDRYPKGKIFNYNESGSVSDDSAGGKSSEGDDEKTRPRGAERPKTHRKREQMNVKQDADHLIQILAGARSIIFCPIWDSHRSKWFSGALVWTNTPKRVLTPENELTYLHAFGNSVMAEVHRLDVEMAERAKTNLVSSISHELRSPLHGILGTADILSDTAMNALQHGMVHTIESCGRTLLEIINHLLDFTYIDKFKKSSYLAQKQNHAQSRKNSSLPAPDSHPMLKKNPKGVQDNAPTYVQLDAVLEEVVESVFAGHSFYNLPDVQPRSFNKSPSGDSDSAKPVVLAKPVTIIFDIQKGIEWGFLTQGGAWRRILMNVFGNALKYTDKGFIYMGLRAAKLPSSTRHGKKSRSADEYQVVLTIKDTGQGISEKYLRNGLFTAFSQEDTFAPGSGLGLSIVRQAINSLGGSIDVSSAPNVGTELSIEVTLSHVSVPENSEYASSNEIFHSISNLAQGQTVGLLGFGTNLTSERDKTLYNSLERLCKEWFHLNVEAVPLQREHTPCDFYLMVQTDLDNPDAAGNQLLNFDENFVLQQDTTSPLIVICQSPETAHNMSVAATSRTETSVIEFISQPCGPRKLAKALDLCIKRHHGRGSGDRSISGPTRWVEMPESSRLPMDVGPSDPPEERMKISKRPTKDTMGSPDRSRPVSPTHVEPQPEPQSQPPLDSPDKQEPPETTEPKDPEPTQPSVLLVEDNDLNLQLLVAYVKKEGLPYMTAKNGLEAVETFQAHPGKFGAVIIDISMPVMDGFEASRQIRRFERSYWTKANEAFKPAWTPTTIAASTGLGSADAQQEAFASGIDAFLTKPVKRQDLKPILKDLSNGHS